MSKYKPAIVEEERRRRIDVALWAYAYELMDDPLVSDGRFDQECYKVDLSINTGNKKMDDWFCKEFDPCTGRWIYSHPELHKIDALYHRVKGYNNETMQKQA